MAEALLCSICGEPLWHRTYLTESLRDIYVEVKPCEGRGHSEALAQKAAFAKQEADRGR